MYFAGGRTVYWKNARFFSAKSVLSGGRSASEKIALWGQMLAQFPQSMHFIGVDEDLRDGGGGVVSGLRGDGGGGTFANTNEILNASIGYDVSHEIELLDRVR